MDVKDDETLIDYRNYLKEEKKQSGNTVKAKFSHAKTWLKKAYKIDPVVKMHRG